MTPQWKLNLLARWPRPIAVLLIMLEDRVRFIIPYAVAAVLFSCIFLATGFFVVRFGLVFTLRFAIVVVVVGALLYGLTKKYLEIERSLPKREKKDAED